MAMVINTNIMSQNAQNNLRTSQSDMNTAMERLSSGKRVNSAADDAAGLAIINRFTSQERGLNMAIRNANDGISMIQTAEGALDETTNILQRMRELSIQSSNGIYSDANRSTLNAEVTQLKAELTRIAETTSFNGLKILDGTLGDIELQVGAESGERINVNLGTGFDAESLGVDSEGTTNSGSFTLSTSTRSSGSGTSGSLNVLETGDLEINGVAVPTSSDLDSVSPAADADGSALAYAAAINSVSAQTGVTATAVTEVNLGDITVTSRVDLGDMTVAEDFADGGLTLQSGELIIDGFDLAGTYAAGGGFSEANFINALQSQLDTLSSGTAETQLGIDPTSGNIFATTTATDGEVSISGSGTLAGVGQVNLGALTVTGGGTLGADDMVINGVEFTTALTAGMTVADFVSAMNTNGALGTAKGWEFYEASSTEVGIRTYGGAETFTIAGDGDAGGNTALSFGTIDFQAGALAQPSTTVATTVGNLEFNGGDANLDFDGATGISQTFTGEYTLDAGDFTINGTSINGTFSTDAELATLISGYSSATGVTADVVSNELVLTAADGRNVVIGGDGGVLIGTESSTKTTFDLAGYNLNTAPTTVNWGEVTLDGNNIELTGDDLSGFATAETVSAIQATGVAYTALSDGDLTIGDYTVDFTNAPNDSLSTTDATASALYVAGAINSTAGLKDEVTASALTVMNLGEIFEGTLDSGAAAGNQAVVIEVNNLSISLSGDVLAGDSNGYLVGSLNAAFNASATEGANPEAYGLVASVNDVGELLITANDGRNIQFEVTTANTTADDAMLANLDLSVTQDVKSRGTVALTANDGFSLGDIGGAASYLAGIDSSGSDSIADLDISTQQGAQDAIAVVDRALDYIADSRGDLGAASNRLEFTINNLSSVVENAASARSRVQDADFAVESAALARAQVLQQAGTAMLAQANAAPQSVLSLLQ